MVPALFKVLGQNCSHLQRLSLHMGKLLLIPMASLPLTLIMLEIHICHSSLVWIECKEDRVHCHTWSKCTGPYVHLPELLPVVP